MNKHLISHVSVFIVAAVALLLLAGCSLWPQPAADPSRYYVLSTAPAAAPTEADARPDIALSVARIQLPAYLDRTELVFSPAENRLEVHDVHLWLEPLGKAVTRVFSQDLAQRLGTGRIAIAPSLDVYRDAVQVQVEVIRFDGAVGREVTLRARWRLSRLADGETLFVGERTVSVPLADAPGQQGYVKGMSLALDQLSEAVAQDVRRLNKRP